MNCRWATSTQGARNRSSNTLVEFDGRKLCLIEWAEEYGINYDRFLARLKRGWEFKRALTEESHA